MKIKCTPEEGTTKTNIIERTIGRAVSVDTATDPLGPASSDLVGDTFQGLYDMELEPLKDKESPKTRFINHALMKWLSEDEQFMQTRQLTTGKLILALTSSKMLYEYLLTDEAIREALKVQEELNKEAMSGGDGEEDEQKRESALNRLGQIRKNVIGSQIISNAAKSAGEAAEKADSALRSWGIEAGDITVTDVENIMGLLNHNSEMMEKIAELAGRFESVCAKALEKTRQAYLGQVVDVHRTQDFNLMFPSELCYLMSPDVPQLFHARYVSDFLAHGLLGFELRSEGKEFGSLYIMVDGSGSMNPQDGGFEIQAKAIALGLARALKKDKLSEKEYKLCTFGSEHDGFIETNSTEGVKEHFEWAEKFQNGGTAFSYAMNHAMSNMKEMQDGTDLVFITDGEGGMDESTIRKWKKYHDEHGTRLLYVDVSGRDNNQLHNLCDLYMAVKFDKEGNMDMIAENIAETLATSIERQRLAKLEEKGDN